MKITEEQTELITRLREIASFDSDATHDEGCWRTHDSCAIILASTLLDDWSPICCGNHEHDLIFLAPECPECNALKLTGEK